MFTGPTFLGFYLFAVWAPGSKSPGILITGNGRTIVKETAGKGGAKGSKGGA